MEGIKQEFNKDDKQILEINSNIFEKKAILNTSYLFTHRVYINIGELRNGIICVDFSNKIKGEDLNSITKEFCNELIDQQVRLNCEHDFGHIRDRVVEEAFKPINKDRINKL
ncbi:MAG: His-Xaa-Ser system protein HxsD [Planctomycetes bacterium]|nr:His-Xaa-Ser system protein HxsD [Planctomycetota bacterium]